MSRIKINAIENESIVNNTGDVDSNVLKMLREIAESSVPSTSNDPGPTTSNNLSTDHRVNPKFKNLSETRIIPPLENELTLTTPHSNINETTNDGIPILDEPVDNKLSQIIVLLHVHPNLSVTINTYENFKILTVKIPKM